MTDLSTRYGRNRRSSRFWWIFGIIGVCLGTAWAAWVGFQPRDVSSQVVGFDVRSDTETVVTIDVVRHVESAVTCTVYVLADDHSNVGERTVRIGADRPSESRLDVSVRTEREGVTGLIRGCQKAA